MEQRVIELFHQSIEAKMSCGEHLAPRLVSASQLVVNRLLDNAKILCCGNGQCANLAATMNLCLSNRYRIERPGFAALTLSSDASVVTGLAQQHDFNTVFSRQVRTLGNPEDLLVTFVNQDPSDNIVQAIRAAHDREMSVIAFGGNDDNISALLNGDDVNIDVELNDPNRILEVHLLSLFCLCDLVEQQLFGGIE